MSPSTLSLNWILSLSILALTVESFSTNSALTSRYQKYKDKHSGPITPCAPATTIFTFRRGSNTRFRGRCSRTVANANINANIIEEKASESIIKQVQCVLPLDQVTDKLHEIIKSNKKNKEILIATEGYITHRRKFGSSLAFIDLVCGDMNNMNMSSGESNVSPSIDTKIVQALLKKQEYKYNPLSEQSIPSSSPSSSSSSFKAILKSLHPGTKVYIEGKASKTQNPGEVVLLVSYIKFIGISRNPEHLKGMLQRVKFINDVNDGNASEVEGLLLDDLKDAFNGIVNLDSLEKLLRGKIDTIDSLILSSQALPTSPTLSLNSTSSQLINNAKNIGISDINTSSNNNSVKQWNSKRITMAKIARIIVDSLPHDPLDIQSSVRDYRNDNEGIMKKNEFEHCSISDLFEKQESEQQLKHPKDSNNVISLHTISGWVQNRRRFQGDTNSITVLEVVDDEDYESQNQSVSTNDNSDESLPESTTYRLKCILHTSCMNPKQNQSSNDRNQFIPSDVYGHLMSKGSRVQLRGYFSRKNMSQSESQDNRPIFWVTEAKICRLSWRPNVVRYFLDCLSTTDDGITSSPFGVQEIKEALDLTGHDEVLELQTFCRDEGETERQWRAAELSRKLQDSHSRLGKVSREMIDVLEKYSWLKDKFPLEHLDLDGPDKDSPPPGAFDGLEALAPMSRSGKQKNYLRRCFEGSRWQRVKRPQLQWMTKQIIEVVQSHPHFGLRKLRILDIGGGRGHLANYLASRLGEEVASVHVIDIDSRTIKNGAKEAEQKSLDVQYEVGDASKLFEESSDQTQRSFDVIVALHACGALSDVALAYATSNQAALVVTPCCFRSNQHLLVPKSDGDGSSQDMVPPSAWLGLEQSDLDTLQLAAEIQGDRTLSEKAIHIICALRSAAILQHSSLRHFDVKIKTFPISFSTRNHCLVGSFYK